MSLLLFKTLVFTLIAPGTVTILVPYLLLSSESSERHSGNTLLQFLGGISIMAGGLLYLRCAWDFVVSGKGTPAPIDAPKELVVHAPYRYVRNPMYVGVLILLLGESLFFESWLLLAYSACVFLVFSGFVLLYEEPALKRKFGGSYERYCRQVPRWIPKVFRGRAR